MGVSSTKMVHSILRDSKGTMWFGTNAGLFSYANNRLKNISDEVDIPTNFVNKNPSPTLVCGIWWSISPSLGKTLADIL
jgi:hypothetical protein